MTNKMPSASMMEASSTNSVDNPPSTTVKEAIQALQQLNKQEINLLQTVLSGLNAQENSQEGISAANADGVSIQSTGDTALKGMEAAKQVQNLGFVEFTAGLINGTFDAIVGATVKQMEAYAKLVADLSKSIQQFQAENVSEAQITQHLADRYPDGTGGTLVVPEKPFPKVEADNDTGTPEKTANQLLKEVVGALVAETKGLSSDLKITSDSLNIAPNDDKFSLVQVTKIRSSIGALLATNMISQLREMARDGMARIVITDGEIMTKLTFNITTNELQEKKKENYNKNVNRTQIGGGAGALWWRVSANTDNTNLNVNSMNERSFDSTTMSTEMIGQVKIRFKTESFPPYVPPTPSEEKNTQS